MSFLERSTRHLTDTDSFDGPLLYELSHVSEDGLHGSVTQPSEGIYVQFLVAQNGLHLFDFISEEFDVISLGRTLRLYIHSTFHDRDNFGNILGVLVEKGSDELKVGRGIGGRSIEGGSRSAIGTRVYSRLHGGKSIFLGEGHRIDAKTPGGKAHETIT